MNPNEFFSKRFGTHIKGSIKKGDIVKFGYDERGIVLRDPYPIGADKELFTSVFCGYYLSSQPVKELEKTGETYINELSNLLNAIYGIKEEKDNV